MLEPSFMPHMAELQQQCVGDLMESSDWRTVVPSSIFRPQGQSAFESLYSDLAANDPAYFSISVPTLLVQGASDTMVSAYSTLSVGDHLRKNGAPVTYKAYLGATHGTVLTKSIDDVAAWIGQRFLSE